MTTLAGVDRPMSGVVQLVFVGMLEYTEFGSPRVELMLLTSPCS
jgi:hypothetical protein